MTDIRLPIAIFNGTVVTSNGLYRISDIDVDASKELIQRHGSISAIGHEATAKIMSEILEVDIPMNRIQFVQEVGQYAIVFKLNIRPAEGVILTSEELKDIGFALKLMERLE